MGDGPTFTEFVVAFVVCTLIAVFLAWAGHEMFPKETTTLATNPSHTTVPQAILQMTQSLFPANAYLNGDDLTGIALRALGMTPSELASAKTKYGNGQSLNQIITDSLSSLTATPQQIRQSLEQLLTELVLPKLEQVFVAKSAQVAAALYKTFKANLVHYFETEFGLQTKQMIRHLSNQFSNQDLGTKSADEYEQIVREFVNLAVPALSTTCLADSPVLQYAQSFSTLLNSQGDKPQTLKAHGDLTGVATSVGNTRNSVQQLLATPLSTDTSVGIAEAFQQMPVTTAQSSGVLQTVSNASGIPIQVTTTDNDNINVLYHALELFLSWQHMYRTIMRGRGADGRQLQIPSPSLSATLQKYDLNWTANNIEDGLNVRFDYNFVDTDDGSRPLYTALILLGDPLVSIEGPQTMENLCSLINRQLDLGVGWFNNDILSTDLAPLLAGTSRNVGQEAPIFGVVYLQNFYSDEGGYDTDDGTWPKLNLTKSGIHRTRGYLDGFHVEHIRPDISTTNATGKIDSESTIYTVFRGGRAKLINDIQIRFSDWFGNSKPVSFEYTESATVNEGVLDGCRVPSMSSLADESVLSAALDSGKACLAQTGSSVLEMSSDDSCKELYTTVEALRGTRITNHTNFISANAQSVATNYDCDTNPIAVSGSERHEFASSVSPISSTFSRMMAFMNFDVSSVGEETIVPIERFGGYLNITIGKADIADLQQQMKDTFAWASDDQQKLLYFAQVLAVRLKEVKNDIYPPVVLWSKADRPNLGKFTRACPFGFGNIRETELYKIYEAECIEDLGLASPDHVVSTT